MGPVMKGRVRLSPRIVMTALKMPSVSASTRDFPSPATDPPRSLMGRDAVRWALAIRSVGTDREIFPFLSRSLDAAWRLRFLASILADRDGGKEDSESGRTIE